MKVYARSMKKNMGIIKKCVENMKKYVSFFIFLSILALRLGIIPGSRIYRFWDLENFRAPPPPLFLFLLAKPLMCLIINVEYRSIIVPVAVSIHRIFAQEARTNVFFPDRDIHVVIASRIVPSYIDYHNRCRYFNIFWCTCPHNFV